MVEIFIAALAGILTVGAPCILPLLPILLGSSIGGSKTRPIFIALGFTASFTVVALTLSVITTSFNLDPSTLRHAAVIGLILFGIFMLWPKPFEMLAIHLSKLSSKATEISSHAGQGNFGGFVLGMFLGIIWTPCAGPVLGSILTLIATQTNLLSAGILLVAYSVGASIPMMIVAYGGQIVTSKVKQLASYTNTIQKIFGIVIILIAVMIFFNFDTIIQTKILNFYNFSSLEQKLLQ